MKKKYSSILLLLLILFLASCKGKVDVDKLSIASAIGIDKSDNGFKVTAQVVNPAPNGQGGGSKQPPVVVHSEEAKTVSEALRKLTTKFPSMVFTAHFDVLFYGEDLAKEGILAPSIYFYTDNLSRHSFISVVVKGATAEELLRVKTPVSKIPSTEIYNMVLSTGSIYSVSTEYFMDEVITNIKSTGSELALSTVEIIGKGEEGSENKNIETLDVKTLIRYSNLAVFKADKLVGYLSLDEARGYSHLQKNIQTTINSVTIDDDVTVAYEVYNNDLNIDFEIKDDIPVFSVKHEVMGRLASISTGAVTVSKEEINKIEKAVSQDIKKLMEMCIDKSKELNSDIVGFGQMIHKKDLDYWRSIKDNYDEIYEKMKINIEVDVTLDSKGY